MTVTEGTPTRLEQVRIQFGFSRAEVANGCGWSEKTVYRLERGITPTNGRHLRLLARFYNIPARDLMDGAA